MTETTKTASAKTASTKTASAKTASTSTVSRASDPRRAPTWDDIDPERAARLHADTERDRETYTQSGYQPVSCTNCSTTVHVRKNSEKHTSIQWRDGADAGCPVLTAWRDGEERPIGEDTCPKILASIRYAYAEGLLTLAEGVDPADSEHMVNPLHADRAQS